VAGKAFAFSLRDCGGKSSVVKIRTNDEENKPSIVYHHSESFPKFLDCTVSCGEERFENAKCSYDPRGNEVEERYEEARENSKMFTKDRKRHPVEIVEMEIFTLVRN